MKNENEAIYDLKIRQSYHGDGGMEGYRYKVYDSKGKKLGELKKLPTELNIESIVLLNGKMYEIVALYVSENPGHERSEVMYYELKEYVFKPDFELGEIIK